MHIRREMLLGLLFLTSLICDQSYRLQPLKYKPLLSSSKTPFVDALVEVVPSLKHRYFFPGHANLYFPSLFRDKLPLGKAFEFDVPELDGLDNIHAPEGPLLEALQMAARHFNAYRTWFLVNGSTSGILTAVFSAHRIFQRQRTKNSKSQMGSKDKVYFIVGRDCHKSVFDAIALSGADTICLPCHVEEDFGISLGVDFAPLKDVLDSNLHQVDLIFPLSSC